MGDPRPMYYVAGVVVAALVVWVISVLVRRLPPWEEPGAAKPPAPPPGDADPPAAQG